MLFGQHWLPDSLSRRAWTTVGSIAVSHRVGWRLPPGSPPGTAALLWVETRKRMRIAVLDPSRRRLVFPSLSPFIILSKSAAVGKREKADTPPQAPPPGPAAVEAGSTIITPVLFSLSLLHECGVMCGIRAYESVCMVCMYVWCVCGVYVDGVHICDVCICMRDSVCIVSMYV